MLTDMLVYSQIENGYNELIIADHISNEDFNIWIDLCQNIIRDPFGSLHEYAEIWEMAASLLFVHFGVSDTLGQYSHLL